MDVRAVFQQSHRDLALNSMPSLLLPRKGKYGLTDHEKIFCPDLKHGPDIFDLRGIDRDRGALLAIRPGQFIARVLPLTATDEPIGFLASRSRLRRRADHVRQTCARFPRRRNQKNETTDISSSATATGLW